MATYKMILRDADNSETSELHVYEVTCEAKSREEARAIFEQQHGNKNVVAGPIKVEN